MPMPRSRPRFTWRRRGGADGAEDGCADGCATARTTTGRTGIARAATTPATGRPEPSTERPELSGLMGRAEVPVLSTRGRRLIARRRVLVTGAGGTVGSALCRQIARSAPQTLCLLDGDAARLERLRLELGHLPDDDRITVVHLDVRDREHLNRLFGEARPELVFHTAGRTGVRTLEDDPCEGVAINVLGTRHVVEASVRHRAERLVFVSSDKAADPASVFGATKRLGELVLQQAAGAATRFAAVRIGDVIGAPGPLLPTLAGRLARNEPISIPHPQVARHFMTVAEASGLILEAAALAEEAETFALDTGGPVPVVDLVHRFAEQLHSSEVTIRFSGLGSGEKLTEKAFSDSEHRVPTAHPKIWATYPAPPPADLLLLLDRLFAAAGRGDDEQVLLLLRRLLPEYRPVRRPRPPDGGSR